LGSGSTEVRETRGKEVKMELNEFLRLAVANLLIFFMSFASIRLMANLFNKK